MPYFSLMTIDPISKQNTKVLKIAIFSGSIPSTTFIEHLIEGVAQWHEVLLFGVVDRPINYRNKRVVMHRTPRYHWMNLGVTSYRSIKLLLSRPRHFLKLIEAVKPYYSFYAKWIWFSKLLPIVLYRPDIFHIQWARDLEFYICLKELFHIPVVVSLRGAHINYTPIIQPEVADLYRNTFPKVDIFHAVSKAIIKKAESYGDIRSRTKMIHSPVPKLFFDSFSLIKKYDKPKIEVVSVGRFHWIKGYRYALDALQFLKEWNYDISYTIVGPIQTTEDIAFQINQLNLEDHVHVLPHMEQDVLIDFVKSKDVLLLTSIEEGIANVVLEAMALGVPVISTNCGGMSEVVFPNETGWLVPERDAEEIANAIVKVSRTKEHDLQRITQKAHDFVKIQFDSEDSIKQFLELYEGIMEK